MPEYHDRLDQQTGMTSAQVLGLFRRALGYLRPVRGLLLTRLSLVTLIFVIGLPMPWFLKIVVDHGVQQMPITDDLLYPFFMEPFLAVLSGQDPLTVTLYTLLVLAGLFSLVGYSGNTYLDANLAEGADVATQSENKVSQGSSSAHGLIGVLDLSVAIRLSQRITNNVRVALFGRINRLPMPSLNVQRSGDAMFRVMHDTPSVAGICHALTINPYGMLISVALNLWILWLVYGAVAPELVWLGFSAVFLTLLATSPLASWMRRVSQQSRASGSATTDDLEEGIKNIAAVQSLGGSDLEQEKFANASRESFRQSWLLIVVRNAVVWITEHVHLVFATLGFYFIGSGIVAGNLTLGDVPVVLRMYSLLYETSMLFGQIWIEQQDNAAAARRVFFLMDQKTEQPSQQQAVFDPGIGIRFDNVSFAYPDGRQVLEDISLDIAPGEFVAIAGPTGAGKTTLAQLIPGFIQPQSGELHVGGLSMNDDHLATIRSQVAYVFQEHQLVNGTIAENLRIARPSATYNELVEACRRADALGFIEAQALGFDSPVTRAGGNLSVGQKQRLSIARALLRDAPIMILDEPTAALDAQAESHLMRSIETRTEGTTLIVIAHRLATIAAADRIVFMNDGRIVEQGTHDELLELENGLYREFVSLGSE